MVEGSAQASLAVIACCGTARAYQASPKTGTRRPKRNAEPGTPQIWREKRAMSIQYHPEAGPGPHDSDVNFRPFVEMMAEAKLAAAGKR